MPMVELTHEEVIMLQEIRAKECENAIRAYARKLFNTVNEYPNDMNVDEVRVIVTRLFEQVENARLYREQERAAREAAVEGS